MSNAIKVCIGDAYPIKNDEVRAYMKVISNLRDGEKIWDMSANRDKI